uniref:Uncharacterized protein n=1 Tax=Anguilla anguilla TaxID=7936 RepID=A0A0E9RWI7_ANGAN
MWSFGPQARIFLAFIEWTTVLAMHQYLVVLACAVY